jgi:hypothetical protein
MEFVPPDTLAKNRVLVSTFREMVAGSIVTVIAVVGSVHEFVEVVVDVVAVVVQVIAVLGAAYLWHETRLSAPISITKIGRRLTAPLSSNSHMPIRCGSVATSIPKIANYIPSCLLDCVLPFGPAVWRMRAPCTNQPIFDLLREDIPRTKTA